MSIIVDVLKINLRKNTLTPEATEKKLNDIVSQVKYMDQTVKDFQNFFNPSKEKIRFNVYDTIQTVFDLVRYAYEHKSISLILEGDRDIMLEGHPNEFSQVILTLVQNARDAFMENPKEEMKIITTIFEERGHCIVTVRDNAGGIPDEIIEHVFDLYMTTKSQGTGLGLNIAKQMVEKNMHGKLTVRNVEDGAEFRIDI
jgi:signal transduction histidine kinase